MTKKFILNTPEASKEFERLLEHNMLKTRMCKIPAELEDRQQRHLFFMDYCYKVSAKEAFEEMVKNG